MSRTYTLDDLLHHVSIHGDVTTEEQDRLTRYCHLKHNQDIWTEALEHRPPVRTGDRYS